ncbi:glycoside hydrolase/deacetylase [Aspergillus heteromorphus CBS 117.55]|uniref:Glycoside hydrolase/deacetylase n=1 Tax=Aspergillus heteromorphus CBS 117.55 TaxID=1448321 RepID=A0A317WMX9_9EURO|nr:glycoside hydrolase/deacetylase [Aspergillus heteromorphus CBS 117.55]PWY87749.1 glycoside hydrolase/deacetylase [Aspergillus heteromorphus CBS 117.55]
MILRASLLHLFLTLFALFALLSTTSSHPTNQSLPYGTVLDHCVIPGTIALTFDDGPYVFTPALLDILAEHGVRATFFVNGYRLAENVDVLQRIVAEGHQVASHTYNHAYLPSLDYTTIVQEMQGLESLFRSFVGIVPHYMRPPYLAVDERVLAAMSDLGYHVIGASVDTKDFEKDDPWLIHDSIRRFVQGVNAGGSIVLAHDLYEQTVYTLTRAMLKEVKKRGLMATTVADCMGDPKEYWYHR